MRSLKLEELCLVAGAGVGPTSTKHEDNGLGNGNDAAPGGSLDNNGAENNVDGTTTGNPPGSGKWPVVPN